MKRLSILAAAALFLSVLSAPAVAEAAPPTTQLTLQVSDCDGCTIGVASYLQGSMDVWSAKPKKVKEGSVTFEVPTVQTTGLSITVRAPWEGATGYVTNVALRYQGQQPGDKIGFSAAREPRGPAAAGPARPRTRRPSRSWPGRSRSTASAARSPAPSPTPR